MVDQTGLEGSYDVVLPLPPKTGGTSPFANTSDTEESISSALAQLGLKQTATKAEADGLVVDHIKRLRAN